MIIYIVFLYFMVFSLTGNKRLFLYYLAPLSLCRAYLLFVTLPTPNYPKILQIKRRYSIIHSDEYYVRLFYPLPSVIIS